MTIFASIILAVVTPVYTAHNNVKGNAQTITNIVEWATYVESAISGGGGGGSFDKAVLNRTNMNAYADDISKTNGSIVGRIWQLEQQGIPMWDLELTKSETIPASAYRGAYNLKSVISYSPNNTIGIGSMSFAYLPNLKNVVLAKATIGSDSFYGCSFDELIISNSTSTVIDNNIFGGSRNNKIVSVPFAKTIQWEFARYDSFCEYFYGDNIETITQVNCFDHSYTLKGISMPKLKKTNNGFCSGATKVEWIAPMDECTDVGAFCFTDMANLTNFPSMASVTNWNSVLNAKKLTKLPYMPNVMQFGCSYCPISEFNGYDVLERGVGEDIASNSTSLTNAFGLSKVVELPGHAFLSDRNLKYIGKLSSCHNIIGSALSGINNKCVIDFGTQSSSDVMSITGFQNIPSGSSYTIRCADGDFYRSGSSLIAK